MFARAIHWQRLLALACAALALLAGPAWAQRRVALVIGNSGYSTENKLSNPVNDAKLIAGTLKDLGFTVELKIDMAKRDMELSIARFTRESGGADSAVFYFAGHGAQLVGGGRNYLLPVDARVDGDDTLESDGIPADRIVEQLERGPNPAKLRLVILDACRNNSLAGKARSGIRGLARMTPSNDYTLIAFSTNDQDVALDGTGANSPYTRALAKHFAKAREIPLRRVFELTALDVREATGQQQRPRTYGDLDSRVTLDGRILEPELAAAKPAAAPVPSPSTEPAPPSAEQVEVQVWTEVKRSNIAAGYRAYLAEYPDGRYAKFARIELAKIDAQNPPPARAAASVPPAAAVAADVAARKPAAGATPSTSPSAAPAPSPTARLSPAPAPSGSMAPAPSSGPSPGGLVTAPAPAATAPPVQVALAPATQQPSPALSGLDLRSLPGRVFRYTVTDKMYGGKRDLARAVTSADANRVVYGDGARIEDGLGQLVSVSGVAVSDFETIEPPRGWASLLQAAGEGSQRWTARDGLNLMMDTPTRRKTTVTVAGRSVDAVQVRWSGRASWPPDLLAGPNYIVQIEITFDPQSQRVLQMTSSINAPRSGLSGARNSTEEVTLVGVQ